MSAAMTWRGVEVSSSWIIEDGRSTQTFGAAIIASVIIEAPSLPQSRYSVRAPRKNPISDVTPQRQAIRNRIAEKFRNWRE